MKNTIIFAFQLLPSTRKAVAVCTALFIGMVAYAQPCILPIFSNTFEIKPATCAGSVANLQGSNPLGGVGNYTYQWQKSVGNCGNGNFSDIPGATERDYAVPASTANNDCFRRIVRSGSCSNT
ncbi:MAG TPA: hypothetical protein VMR70_08440, partial [Flavisolibacter sp.]|nr:hypothetical protein [Flavisolibacter sp.]